MVDVVITTYKRPKLTLEAIDSVLKQSYDNLRIFVIEDGSDELASTLPSDKRIIYQRLEKNQGPSYGRNLGASLGDAEYVAFLDSDDLWQPSKLEKQIAHLERNDENYIHTNEKWFRHGQEVKQRSRHRKQGGKFIERSFELCLISPSSVLFRRQFWQSHGGFLPHFRVAEDYELWLRLNFEFEIAYLDEPLTIKRAGDWPQLSSNYLLDHYRVLALHRFYRLFKNHSGFAPVGPAFVKSLLKKVDILIKGAKKYHHVEKLNQYQRWQMVANKIAKNH